MRDPPDPPGDSYAGRVPRVCAAAVVVGAFVLLTGCGASAATPRVRTTTAAAKNMSAPVRGGPSTTTTVVVSTTTTSPAGSPPWTVVSRDAGGVAVEEQTFSALSGRPVTLVRFDAGSVVFDLHIGTSDPPANLAALPPDRGPALAADETPFLLAAFNGGFKANAGPGGVQVQGQAVTPLVAGKASFVIDVNGTAHVGVWGTELPTPGEQVASVRQNLAPLISNGVPNPTVDTPADWGATVNKSMVVARSAVGQDAAGNVIYAGGSALLPSDLSAALLGAGAVNAMQLDINPEWVQLDATGSAGGPLVALVPGQNRPASQYLSGWTRDFFAVMGLTFVPRLRPR